MLEWQGIEFQILKLKLHSCTAYRVVGAGVGGRHQGCHADDSGRTDGQTDRRTDKRTDARTMAAGSSVTWTHYSVRYEVI
jgi:hypothetical protein